MIRLPEPGRIAILLAAIVTVLVIVCWHLAILPRLPEQPWLHNLGGLSELVILLLIALMLTAVQYARLPASVHLWLSVGLALWICSAVVDVMDELVRQPRLLSVFGEDITRVLGMLATFNGMRLLLQHSQYVRRQLEQQALQDELTGLSNRRHFTHYASMLSQSGMSLIMLDLDHFKRVNDTYGHCLGDDALRALGNVLHSRGVYAARLGGEEFAVVLPEMSDSALLAFAEILRVDVAGLDILPEGGLTVSIGVGRLQPGETPAQLQQRVDRALYRAKANGRNRCELAS